MPPLSSNFQNERVYEYHITHNMRLKPSSAPPARECLRQSTNWSIIGKHTTLTNLCHNISAMFVGKIFPQKSTFDQHVASHS